MSIKKRFAALGAVIMMVASMSAIGASASNGKTFSLYYISSTNRHTTGTYVVSGLTTSNDNAIDFYCSNFTGGTGGSYVKGDIQADMKKITGEYIFLDRTGDSGSISFNSNWYGYSNGGQCSVTTTLYNYNSTYVSATGTVS